MHYIVHISGCPGSGKTTLANKLRLIEHVSIIDTDELISASSSTGQVLDAARPKLSTQVFSGVWRMLFGFAARAALADVRPDTRVVAFVGTLTQFASEHSCETLELDAILGRSLHMKCFMWVDRVQLLRQFYGRYFHMDSCFWEDIADRRYEIPSSSQKLTEDTAGREWHIAHGYRMAHAGTIHTIVHEMTDLHYDQSRLDRSLCE